MKVTKSALTDALSKIKRVKGVVLPFTEVILDFSDEPVLFFKTYDAFGKISVPAEISEKERTQVKVSLDYLSSVISACPEGIIDITVENNLNIKSGRFEAKVTLTNLYDYEREEMRNLISFLEQTSLEVVSSSIEEIREVAWVSNIKETRAEDYLINTAFCEDKYWYCANPQLMIRKVKETSDLDTKVPYPLLRMLDMDIYAITYTESFIVSQIGANLMIGFANIEGKFPPCKRIYESISEIPVLATFSITEGLISSLKRIIKSSAENTYLEVSLFSDEIMLHIMSNTIDVADVVKQDIEKNSGVLGFKTNPITFLVACENMKDGKAIFRGKDHPLEIQKDDKQVIALIV